MINMLCMIFGEHCPVFSKPTGLPQQQPRMTGYPIPNICRMPYPVWLHEQQPYGPYPWKAATAGVQEQQPQRHSHDE